MSQLMVLTVKSKNVITVITIIICLGALAIVHKAFNKDDVTTISPDNNQYVILAMNDLGMHCLQGDYSSFLILPPGNTLKVQVFKRSKREAKLVNSGIKVTYEMIDNTRSADKTNFWEFAKDYGYNVPPNIGITGNGLKGTCILSNDRKYYEATAIPVLPYNDGSKKKNPYQIAKILIYDEKTGKELAMLEKVVVPVSDEMNCNICHGGTDTDKNVLKAHDKLSGTRLFEKLQQGVRYKCSDCHKDNVLGEPGKPGIKPLSLAMHGFHADKMKQSEVEPVCYTCHPGIETKCNRGRMYAAGIKCDNSKCHGNMQKVARTQTEGREAWLQEPDCGTCHGKKHSSNRNQLYRNSYLINSPSLKMDGKIQCASCHNSPHAEWKSTLKLDNFIPEKYLGYASFINKCSVCHEGRGKVHVR